MAERVNLIKGNIKEDGFVGFSWTIFFFGFWVPIFRKDFKSALVIAILTIVIGYMTMGAGILILDIVLGFFYNKYYTEQFIKNGFQPADDYSKELLEKNKIYID